MPGYILTVTSLNRYIKSVIEEDFNLKNVYVKGEISNFTNHIKSGHFYLTLKDEGAQIKAVMFKSANSRLKFLPENAMSVICRGYIGIYEKTGEYQLYIEDMQPDGTGALAVAFEQLKKKLADAGFFDQSHKKAIPSFPQKIGVVTSESGAAVKDIINVISRRYPLAEIIVSPVEVQGEKAAPQIAQAIDRFNRLNAADTLIVGRGGGSVEDLWAFNEKIVAEAVYNSIIPVISAVGHETDFTICDFVADLRAPTPSAAAELAVPDISELKEQLYLNQKNINNLSYSFLKNKKAVLNDSVFRLEKVSPKNKLDNLALSVDNAISSMTDSVKAKMNYEERLLSELIIRLDSVSPLKTLSRGYGIVTKNGKIISDSSDVSKDDLLDIRLNRGSIECRVV